MGLVVAFFVGAGIGVSAANSVLPAEDNPVVQARLAELAQREETIDEQAEEQKEALALKASELDEREAELKRRNASLDKREMALDKRSERMSSRETKLDERAKRLNAEEKRIADNTIPGDGVYVVGEDVKAGTYKTSGPAGGSIDMCYYAFRRGTGSDAALIDNNIVRGQATVTLQPGQVFETQSCSEWKRQ
ncbi:hypothetical protein [Haloechinothrix salitolerans]|uniref:3D (Asp-Asp-Asp) domain-containing protein n=1 Tax=Haloechinothrix salitolerans TaxID=926830 RepID=A0ABW2BX06_9PSEU